MEKTAKGLVAWARSYLGQAYWYGTFGQPCSQSLHEQKQHQYPSHYTPSRAARYASDIAQGKRCVDCVGLIKGYVWHDGAAIRYHAATDVSADGLYGAAADKGPLTTMPEEPGVLVWSKGHIGVYIGGGEVVEARGFAYGVVQSALKDRGFTHWCRCPYIDYEAPKTIQPPADTRFAVKRLLKTCVPMQRGEDVLWLQKSLAANGYACGAFDGLFGPKTKAAVCAYQKAKGLAIDGVAGRHTVTALGGRWEG